MKLKTMYANLKFLNEKKTHIELEAEKILKIATTTKTEPQQQMTLCGDIGQPIRKQGKKRGSIEIREMISAQSGYHVLRGRAVKQKGKLVPGSSVRSLQD